MEIYNSIDKCHLKGGVLYLECMYVSLPCCRMLLWDRDDRAYGYYIEVSTDQKTWKRVWDRSEEACR